MYWTIYRGDGSSFVFMCLPWVIMIKTLAPPLFLLLTNAVMRRKIRYGKVAGSISELPKSRTEMIIEYRFRTSSVQLQQSCLIEITSSSDASRYSTGIKCSRCDCVWRLIRQLRWIKQIQLFLIFKCILTTRFDYIEWIEIVLRNMAAKMWHTAFFVLVLSLSCSPQKFLLHNSFRGSANVIFLDTRDQTSKRVVISCLSNKGF